MTPIIVDGKGIADAILANIKTQLDALSEPLHLAAVCVSDDPGLRAFVKLKQKAAQSVGVVFSSYFFDAPDKSEAIKTLKFLAADESIHGIFIELPLPKDWDTKEILSLIPPDKDVDALTDKATVPEPAVLALQYVLTEHDIVVPGAKVAVVGQGMLVGAPITRWLESQSAQVSTIDIDTPAPADIASRADIIIAGVGKAGLVTVDWVKEGAAIIDFGYAKQNDAWVGDVDFDTVSKKAGLVTPVPGGMGPLLIAAVLENLVTLATR